MNEVLWFFAGWAVGSLFTVGALLGLSRWTGGHRLSEQPCESPQEKQQLGGPVEIKDPEALREAVEKKKKHRTMWCDKCGP